MNVVIMGRPGSGKGTQSKRLVQLFGLAHLSTGDMLRVAQQENTPLGRHIAECIDSGNLVADDLIMELVGQRISTEDAENGFLFDGVPRTVAQAQALDDLLAKRGKSLDAVVELDADVEEIVPRMMKRSEREGRADDTPETIRHRMAIYERETAPLINYYSKRGLHCRVDASGTPDEVFERLRECVETD